MVLHGIWWDIPSGNDQQFAIEAMAHRVIVDFPIRNVIFHSKLLNYQRVSPKDRTIQVSENMSIHLDDEWLIWIDHDYTCGDYWSCS